MVKFVLSKQNCTGYDEIGQENFIRGCAIRKRNQIQSELNSTKITNGDIFNGWIGRGWMGVFKSWSWGNHSHLCLLTGITQRKDKLSLILMTPDSITTWNKAPVQIRFLPPPPPTPHRDWETGVYTPWWLHLREMPPMSLRKLVLGCKTGKRLSKYLQFKEFTIVSFLK